MIQRLFSKGLLLVAGAALLAGCEHAAPLEAEEEPTLTNIQANVFNTNCALSGCHLGSSAPFGLDLSEGRARGNLVNIRSGEVSSLFRVEPGNPDDSYLIIKLEGSARMADGTQRMPLGREPLPAELIRIVREWIAAGAPDN